MIKSMNSPCIKIGYYIVTLNVITWFRWGDGKFKVS